MKTEMSNNTWYPSPRYLLRKALVVKCLQSIKCNGKSVLEVGFGSGDSLCDYSKLGMTVYGYDFSPQANYEAKKRLEANKIRGVVLYNSEYEAYSQQYDVLIACEVLEHIEHDEEMLITWNQVLGADGYIIITVPSRMKKWCLNDIWAGHYRRYERNEIYEKMKKSGFEIIYLWSYPFPINIILDYLLNREKKSAHGIETHKQKGFTKIEMTKESGVKREASWLARALSKKWLLYPWHLLQLLFINTDLGSGYVVLAKKL
ncbi:MAG: class I SAM-dependent methyltransferase [Lachnospiraceae bacterium]|nr:class I SAM-dependent methyltransferase [Lachnospiraceae bacterium]